MRLTVFALALLTALTTNAQWTLQATPTTADLRGIDNVGHGIAWASGNDGTILRTLDNGEHWQLCSKPPNGEHLDFRAIQAFDNSTAIIMSSGKGDLSRLYKTTDGCQSWKLLFTNPDKDGFWDALVREDDRYISRLIVLGDPVNGRFTILYLDTNRQPAILSPSPHKAPEAREGESAFAASNSSMFAAWDLYYWIGTGGSSGARVIHSAAHGSDDLTWVTHPTSTVPLGNRTESSGVFSVSFKSRSGDGAFQGVIVGGDYKQPDNPEHTAAFTGDEGKHWTASTTTPHGYRSAVAYDAPTKTWITVGPNGTDISTDDGRDWHPLKPNPAFHEPPDADQHWNALSLPYVVGPHGRIATLRPSALKQP